jgi:hypothetical protein
MVARINKIIGNLTIYEAQTYTTKARQLKAVGALIKDSIIDSIAKETEII